MCFGKLHCLWACQYLERADVYCTWKKVNTGSSVFIVRVYARIQIRLEMKYKRLRAICDMFLIYVSNQSSIFLYRQPEQ